MALPDKVRSINDDSGPSIALVMTAISDLSGSGGAERLFSDLHHHLRFRDAPVRITLITATSALRRLRDAGRVTSSEGIIALRLGERPAQTKPSIAWMTVRLFVTILRGRYDVVHICLPSPIYAPLLGLLSLLPRSVRPRLVVNVIDCTLAHSLVAAPPEETYERDVLDAYWMYARWTRLDAIYSWYRAFVDIARQQPAVAGSARLIRAAKYCFTDTRRFEPAAEKQRLIVFAGRLSEQKRPLLFVDAIAELIARHPQLAPGWRFEMYGKGVLERQVRARIAERHLDDVIQLTHASDMAPVFARSRAIVSTQAFENFTSLSVLEAMAAGNAVIAADVGQSDEFVVAGSNGYLVKHADAAGFADALASYLAAADRHDAMAAASRAIATETHTIGHFADDILAFWHDVVRA